MVRFGSSIGCLPFKKSSYVGQKSGRVGYWESFLSFSHAFHVSLTSFCIMLMKEAPNMFSLCNLCPFFIRPQHVAFPFVGMFFTKFSHYLLPKDLVIFWLHVSIRYTRDFTPGYKLCNIPSSQGLSGQSPQTYHLEGLQCGSCHTLWARSFKCA